MGPELETNPFLILPLHFWTVVFFILGCLVGSFLNVCIHRMPRGESVVSPPSHCPHCRYSIPWFLNIPLVTWLWLGGQCANCHAPIAPRYFLVELLTGALFAACWLMAGTAAPALAAAWCVLVAGLIAATFIDFEHFIIPDEITLGGMGAGFLISIAVPALHGADRAARAMEQSAVGMLVGGGLVYAVLRVGKLAFGREKIALEGEQRIVFAETGLHLPGRVVPFEDIFYRESDTVRFHARTLELVDRCYADVDVRLRQDKLWIGEDEFNPAEVLHLEAVTSELELPREAMGFGDVKFMAAIGAFLGAKATVFALMASSVIGSIVGVTLIALKKQEWSSRLPYGPYIALAAVLWIFGGRDFVGWLMAR